MTLIGDAIHNMPPTGGEGANMALKDAVTLCDAIADERGDLARALAGYQDAMLHYAFDAVDRAMTNTDRIPSGRADRRSAGC